MPPVASKLARPSIHKVVAVLAMLVTLPSLALGFVTDDYAFRALLHAPPPYAHAAYDLFRFASGDIGENAAAVLRGRLPWWAAPDLKIHFVRPLTGLLFALDTWLFGSHALLDHLHSVAWYLALLLAVGALYRRLFSTGPTAFALLVFAWSHAHVYGYAWIAARHVLVGGAPAVLAVWAHVRWQDEAWQRGRWLAPLALAVGLLGSEVAIAGGLYWISFDLLGQPAKGWRARYVACAPALSILAAYLLAYRLIGGGARASGGYHDPLGDPLGFVRVAVTRVPILFGDASFGVPAELSAIVSPSHLAMVGVAATAVLVLGSLVSLPLFAERERTALVWLVPAAALSTVLGATGFPSGRVLLLPDVGFAAWIGVLLARGFSPGSRRTARVLVVGILAVVHLVLAPLSSWRSMRKLAHRARASEAVAHELVSLTPPDGRVFLVASDPLVFLYPRGVAADQDPGALRCMSVLSAAHAGHRVTRTDDRTLGLVPIERPLLDASFETLFRDPKRAFAAGDVVRQCGATIRVTDVEGGHPSRLDVTFDRSLDSGSLVVLTWGNGHLQRFDPPPLGASVEVPWVVGPSGF